MNLPLTSAYVLALHRGDDGPRFMEHDWAGKST